MKFTGTIRLAGGGKVELVADSVVALDEAKALVASKVHDDGDQEWRRALVNEYLAKANNMTFDGLVLKNASREEALAMCAYLFDRYVEPSFCYSVKIGNRP